MDFVTSLPPNNDYNMVLMIVDEFIKKRHFILYTSDKNSTITEATTYLIIKQCLKTPWFIFITHL